MFTKVETALPGLILLRPRLFQDQRGLFIKTFHAEMFRDLGLAFAPREEFYSVSAAGVLRGMHFQLPPAAHAKLVYCPVGRVTDVVLDLRRSSPAYGQWYACELDAINRDLLFIPAGFAHGFLAHEAGSLMVYQTSEVHSPTHDAGVRWDSFGYPWATPRPILSDRDAGFPALADFHSPFA
jgi:dTDP-4-dehydrorhamnose 3,5-epimerase